MPKRCLASKVGEARTQMNEDDSRGKKKEKKEKRDFENENKRRSDINVENRAGFQDSGGDVEERCLYRKANLELYFLPIPSLFVTTWRASMCLYSLRGRCWVVMST